MNKTLVLGIGNTIMMDDGAGVEVIRRLSTGATLPPSVTLLDGGTLGLDLLPYLEGIQRLIVVDAVDWGAEPGTLVRMTGDAVPLTLETRVSPHQMGMKDLLAVARLTGSLPDEVILHGIQPGRIDMGIGFSLPVEHAIDALAMAVQADIR